MSSEIERKYLWVTRDALRGRVEALGGFRRVGPILNPTDSTTIQKEVSPAPTGC